MFFGSLDWVLLFETAPSNLPGSDWRYDAPPLPVSLGKLPQPLRVVLVAQDVLNGGKAVFVSPMNTIFTTSC